MAPPFGTVRGPRDMGQAESFGLFKRLMKEVRWGTVFVESSFSYGLGSTYSFYNSILPI